MIAFQVLPDALLGIADGVGQFYFREIMSIKAFDVILVSGGHRLLGLDDFKIIRDSSGETVPRLRQRLLGQIDRTARYFHLLGGGIQIEQSRPDFVIDSATQIAELGTRLL